MLSGGHKWHGIYFTGTQHLILFLSLNYTIKLRSASVLFPPRLPCCASAEEALGLPVPASARVLLAGL